MAGYISLNIVISRLLNYSNFRSSEPNRGFFTKNRTELKVKNQFRTPLL